MATATFVEGLRAALVEIDDVSLEDDAGVILLRAHLDKMVAHETALFRFVSGEGFVASAADFGLVARGLAALRRATTDEIDFFDGRADLLKSVQDRVSGLFGEPALRRCDYVGPRTGRMCLKPTSSVESRCVAHLSGRGLAGEDFFCRLSVLLELFAGGQTDHPVLTPVYAPATNAVAGEGPAPRAVCRGCARGVTDRDLVGFAAGVLEPGTIDNSSVTDPVTQAGGGVLASDSAESGFSLITSDPEKLDARVHAACLQTVPVYCVACVGLRPWATIFDSALFLLICEEGLREGSDHRDHLCVVVPQALVLPLPLAAIPSGARAIIGQSCVDLGLTLSGDLASLCPPPAPVGMSPALRGAVGPRRREEHMDALARAAGGSLDTPAVPPSVERLRQQALAGLAAEPGGTPPFVDLTGGAAGGEAADTDVRAPAAASSDRQPEASDLSSEGSAALTSILNSMVTKLAALDAKVDAYAAPGVAASVPSAVPGPAPLVYPSGSVSTAIVIGSSTPDLARFLPFGEPAPPFDALHHDADRDGFASTHDGHEASIERIVAEDFTWLAAAVLESSLAKPYGARNMRLGKATRPDLERSHSVRKFTVNSERVPDTTDVELADGLRVTTRRKAPGLIRQSRWRELSQHRIRDLLGPVIAHSGMYASGMVGSTYRTNQAKTLCLVFQLFEATARYLMEDAPRRCSWAEAYEFLGMLQEVQFWDHPIVGKSLAATLSSLASGLSTRDLEQISSPPASLRPVVLDMVNGNFMLLSTVITPAAPPGAGPGRVVPAAPPPPNGGAKDVVKGAQMCAVADCIGYGARTSPPYACTHAFTRACDVCGLMHVRTGKRGWTCAQAAALEAKVTSLPARSAAYKMSCEAFVSAARIAKLDPAAKTTAMAVADLVNALP